MAHNADNPFFEQHRLMQGISGLRALIALQLYFFKSDSCRWVLRELRFCVVDHILHHSTLRLKYVAVCHPEHRSPVVSQLIRKPCQQSSAGDTSEPRGQGLSNINPTSASSSSLTTSTLHEQPGDTSDESDDGTDPSSSPQMYVKSLRLQEVIGIKMWEKEIWNLKL